MFYIVSGLCLVLFTGLIWNSPKSGTPFRKRLRTLLTFLAVFSLWVAGVRPAVSVSEEGKSVLLLTDGAEKLPIDSLRNEINPDYVFRLTRDSLHFQSIEYIPNVLALLAPELTVGEVHIAGYGLDSKSLEKLDKLPLFFYLNDHVKGITELYYEREITLGEDLLIEGKVSSKTGQPFWLVLKSPEGALDSLKIKGSGSQDFSFKTRPKFEGKAVYFLEEKYAESERSKEHPVAFYTKPPELLNVLALQNAPDFETRYLKKWLKEQGHSILWRTAVSKGKYHDEFINRNRISFNKLSRQLLKDIDLLMVDHQTFLGLSEPEKQEIEWAVNRSGMGILLLSDEESLKASNRFFGIHWSAKVEKHMASAGDSPKKLDADLKFEFEKTALLQPLTAQNSRWWCATRPFGKGMAGVNLWNKTYQWQLKGLENQYAQYWSKLLKEISKKQAPELVWKPIGMPVAGQKWSMIVRHAKEMRLEISGPKDDKYSLFGMYNPDDRSESKGGIWPEYSGWYQLTGHGQTPKFEYVFSQENWQSVKKSHLVKLNKRWASKQNGSFKKVSFTKPKPLGLFWFYVVFLFSSAGLWLEMKW